MGYSKENKQGSSFALCRLLTGLALGIILAFNFASAACGANEFDYSNYGDIGIYVIETRTGTVLVETNADKRYAPASTIKLLTALVALDHLGRLDKIVIGEDMLALVEKDSSLAGLVAGEELTIGDLLYGMMLPSGNDAAISMGVECGRVILGDGGADASQAIVAFVEKMNEKAVSFGMVNSNFVNPDGYPKDGQYSTARDLAKLALKADANLLVSRIVKTKEYRLTTNKGDKVWRNSNMLLHEMTAPRDSEPVANTSFNPAANGMKTGSAGGSGGRSFIFTAQLETMSLAGAIMHVTADMAESIFTSANAACDFAFSNYQVMNIIAEGKNSILVKVSNRSLLSRANIELFASNAGFGCYPKDLDPSQLVAKITPNPIFAEIGDDGALSLHCDIIAGNKLADVGFYSPGGELVATIAFIAADNYSKWDYADTLACVLATGAFGLAASTAAFKQRKRASFSGKRF
ncbi:MAG: D-alanyl-D-alanine carboxypeptidase [Eubacteriaceae bacterium]|nr:D-alanyl-D-alanine carboxypeptidase [Eubacteriaceae bacterium]